MKEQIIFERFTDRGRRIIVLAQEEARTCGHNYVGTEHLLAGMVHEEDGIAGQVLTKDFGFTLDGVREQIDKIIGFTEVLPQGHIPFTPRAKKALEKALREGLQLGHNYIGTEHLLLGLIRIDDGVGCQILKEHIDGDMQLQVRAAVMHHFGVEPLAPKAPAVRIAGNATQGLASAKWGPEPDSEDLMIAWAPVSAIDDLVALVSNVRDEISALHHARLLLEKFGFTVTAPPAPDPEPVTPEPQP